MHHMDNFKIANNENLLKNAGRFKIHKDWTFYKFTTLNPRQTPKPSAAIQIAIINFRALLPLASCLTFIGWQMAMKL